MNTTAWMTKKELNATIQAIRDFGNKKALTIKSAKEFLISTGIYTKKGNLKRAYK
jgi:hypothetical protein